jgi:hypothetical protein
VRGRVQRFKVQRFRVQRFKVQGSEVQGSEVREEIRKTLIFVIPAEAGIQYFRAFPASRLRGSDSVEKGRQIKNAA